MATHAPLQKMFHTILAAETTVTDLVDDKIRPDASKQPDKPPSIFMEVVSDEAVDDLGDDSGTGQATVRVVCNGHTRAKAVEVAQAARTALADYRGTVNGVAIQALAYTGVDHEYEPPLDASDEQPWFSEALLFYVFYGPGGPS
jgi:hypothetical protein